MKSNCYDNRELSWLKFNQRVLEEAKDETNPLCERLSFLSIFQSNLDEFFMIRVGSISDMALIKHSHVDSKSGLTPDEQLKLIFKAVPPLYKQRDKLFTHLDRLEADISDGETEVLTGAHEAYLDRIIAWRQELLRLKRYYEQLDSIFDELAENDNSLLGKQNTRRFANLGNRMERYLNAVQSLRESVAQLREAYQSQLSIQQNDLMKIFTVVTAVFLPLTLLVGWYGMNFVGMPELHWKYGYPAVILVSVGIVAALVIYFKKKKWL